MPPRWRSSGIWRAMRGQQSASMPASPPAEHSPIVQSITWERLGHTKVAFTLDRYGHILPGMQEKAAAKLEAILFGR